MKEWVKKNLLGFIVILIVLGGVIGRVKTVFSGNDSIFGTLDGWYSGLAAAVTIFFMYIEILKKEKEESNGKILILPKSVSNEVRFALYNSGQKSGAFEFIGIMLPEILEKYKKDPDNPEIVNFSSILIDPHSFIQNINEKIIVLEGQSVSKVYWFSEEIIKDFLRSNGKYGWQNACIVYRYLNGQIFSGQISLNGGRKSCK